MNKTKKCQKRIFSGKVKTIVENVSSGESVYEYTVGENAQLTLVLTAIGPTQANAYVNIQLSARGARATVIGIVMADRASTVELHTQQLHEAPETVSNLLIKTVLDERATCIYDGGIRVESGAQKTDAYQRNENLLLSPEVHMESKPSLEILANDVRCTHGVATGTLAKEELWYLQSRGISLPEARTLLVSGFLESALNLINDQKTREHIYQQITSRL